MVFTIKDFEGAFNDITLDDMIYLPSSPQIHIFLIDGAKIRKITAGSSLGNNTPSSCGMMTRIYVQWNAQQIVPSPY